MKELNLRAVMVAGRIAEIKQQLEAQKPLYDELDALTIELSGLADTNETLQTPSGLWVTLVDNFAGKNTVWRPAAVKRYDVECLTSEELQKREAKKAKRAAKES